jgi:hypothetical protein
MIDKFERKYPYKPGPVSEPVQQEFMTFISNIDPEFMSSRKLSRMRLYPDRLCVVEESTEYR